MRSLSLADSSSTFSESRILAGPVGTLMMTGFLRPGPGRLLLEITYAGSTAWLITYTNHGFIEQSVALNSQNITCTNHGFIEQPVALNSQNITCTNHGFIEQPVALNSQNITCTNHGFI